MTEAGPSASDYALFAGLALALATLALAALGLVYRRKAAVKALSVAAAVCVAVPAVWLPALAGMDAGWFPRDPTPGAGLAVIAAFLAAWALVAFGLSRAGLWLAAGGSRRDGAFLAFALFVTLSSVVLAGALPPFLVMLSMAGEG